MTSIARWPLILKWSTNDSSGRHAYFIRSLNESGKFYGEVRHVAERRINNVDGEIPEVGVVQIASLLDRILSNIEAMPPPIPTGGWQGLLAVGNVSKPDVIMYASHNGDAGDNASAFAAMVDVLQRYLRHG